MSTAEPGCEQVSPQQLPAVLDAALVVHLITDHGLTEFGGVPTRTCLAVGPDYDDLIAPVTGDLELYWDRRRRTVRAEGRPTRQGGQ